MLAVLAIAAFAVMQARGQANDPGQELQVVVHDGAGTDHVFALADDGSYDISTDLGNNTIRIEDGSVRMEHANCPNGDCTRQAPLTKPGAQLICLPHRLWVEIVPTGDDGESALDVNAVVWEDDDAARDAGIDTVSR